MTLIAILWKRIKSFFYKNKSAEINITPKQKTAKELVKQKTAEELVKIPHIKKYINRVKEEKDYDINSLLEYKSLLNSSDQDSFLFIEDESFLGIEYIIIIDDEGKFSFARYDLAGYWYFGSEKVSAEEVFSNIPKETAKGLAFHLDLML